MNRFLVGRKEVYDRSELPENWGEERRGGGGGGVGEGYELENLFPGPGVVLLCSLGGGVRPTAGDPYHMLLVSDILLVIVIRLYFRFAW